MELVRRRQFLHLAGALVGSAATSQSSWAQSTAGGGPRPMEILRRDLQRQGQKVEETLVTIVTFPPGAVSAWHIHPGAQELVFGLEGRLIVEIEGEGAQPINAGDSGLIPADVPHTVRNETADDTARILVVYSRSDKTRPLRTDVKKS